MTKEQRAVQDLLRLLEHHLKTCDMWEQHHATCASKGYVSASAEKAAHADLQERFTIPLMKLCVYLGFTYYDLVEIIPLAFKTTSEERTAIYNDLFNWAKMKDGLGFGLYK